LHFLNGKKALIVYLLKKKHSLDARPYARQLGCCDRSVRRSPKGTPQPIVNKFDEAFRKAMDEPEFTRTRAQLELDIQYRNSEQTKKFLREQYVHLGKMIRDFNMSTELKEPVKK
jgi:hypothetical protein